MLKVVYNKIIPFKGFRAITLWPFIFVRKDCDFNEIHLNHEKIHAEQQIELLIIFFYIIYLIEWLLKLIYYGFNNKKAYHAISFEKEAYAHQEDIDYLNKRCSFAQWETC